MNEALRPGQIRRLVMYYHYLRDCVKASGQEVVSSAKLAELIDVDDTQVRKDLAAIGVRGQPRVGFNVEEINHGVRKALRLDQVCRALIVGAGRLGGAIASYQGFAKYGLEIKAVYDSDPVKMGSMVGPFTVRDIANLERDVKRMQITVGIIAVPAPMAPAVAERMVQAGIIAIWNFAPTQFLLPPSVRLVNVHLSASLTELCYGLRTGRQAHVEADA